MKIQKSSYVNITSEEYNEIKEKKSIKYILDDEYNHSIFLNSFNEFIEIYKCDELLFKDYLSHLSNRIFEYDDYFYVKVSDEMYLKCDQLDNLIVTMYLFLSGKLNM